MEDERLDVHLGQRGANGVSLPLRFMHAGADEHPEALAAHHRADTTHSIS